MTSPYLAGPTGRGYVLVVRRIWPLLLLAACTQADKPNIGHTQLAGAGATFSADGPVAFGEVDVGGTGMQSVVLTNTGSIAVNVDGLTFGGAGAAAYSTQATVPLTVTASSSVMVQIDFAPTMVATYDATLTVSNDSPGGNFDVVISGTGAGPAINLPANSVDFGGVPLGTDADRSLTIQNQGSRTLSITSSALGGNDAGDFSVQSTLPLDVPAGGSVELMLRFTPSAAGSRTATVDLTTNDPATAMVTIDLTGIGGDAQLMVAPTEIDFGSVEVGQNGTSDLTISNPGSATLTVTTMVFSGPNANEMSLSMPAPLDIPGGGNTTITVTFAPTVVGERDATLTLTSNGAPPTLDIDLDGEGTSPDVTIDPTTLQLGPIGIGMMSDVEIVDVTNTSGGPIQLQGLTISGGAAGRFAIIDTTIPQTIDAAATATVGVRFVPSDAGRADAFLNVDLDVVDATVRLIGRSEIPELVFSPMTLDFGSQFVGVPSTARRVTLENDSNVDLTITRLAIEGADAGSFALVDAEQTPFVIGRQGDRDVMVQFTPAATQQATAQLVIESDDPNAAGAVVMLLGLGVSEVLSVSPMNVAFGAQAPGGPSYEAVDVTNVTREQIVLIEPLITGTGSAAFSVTDAPDMLTADATERVGIRFASNTPGNYVAELRLATTDEDIPPAVVMLSGTITGSGGDGTNPEDDDIKGGCGCSTSHRADRSASWLALVLVGLFLLRRRP